MPSSEIPQDMSRIKDSPRFLEAVRCSLKVLHNELNVDASDFRSSAMWFSIAKRNKNGRLVSSSTNYTVVRAFLITHILSTSRFC